jgi:hypothetical protein
MTLRANKLKSRQDNSPMADGVTNALAKGISRALLAAVLLVLAFDAQHPTQAQTYCAMYDSGGKDCGIPSLASCQQSVSGVGGVCVPDQSAQLRPDFFQRRRLFQPSPPDQGGMFGGNLDQMPPPPDE